MGAPRLHGQRLRVEIDSCQANVPNFMVPPGSHLLNCGGLFSAIACRTPFQNVLFTSRMITVRGFSVCLVLSYVRRTVVRFNLIRPTHGLRDRPTNHFERISPASNLGEPFDVLASVQNVSFLQKRYAKRSN